MIDFINKEKLFFNSQIRNQIRTLEDETYFFKSKFRTFFSDNGVKSKPLIEMFPEVGLCKPPAIVRNVLLPEPEGPIIETNSP